MPEIDVSDIILDEFIAGEGFWVYRRLEVVNDHGRAEIKGAWLPAVGSVFPSGDNSLARQEAFQTQESTITVVTTLRLRGQVKTKDGKSYQPDLVYWDENFYIVRDLKNWSRYGAGFMEADCSSIQLNDRPAEMPSTAVPGALDFSRAENSGLLGVL